MYWSSDDLYQTVVFNETRSRDRFLQLHRFLHFADNLTVDTNDAQRDRLFKIWQVVNRVNKDVVKYTIQAKMSV